MLTPDMNAAAQAQDTPRRNIPAHDLDPFNDPRRTSKLYGQASTNRNQHSPYRLHFVQPY